MKTKRVIVRANVFVFDNDGSEYCEKMYAGITPAASVKRFAAFFDKLEISHSEPEVIAIETEYGVFIKKGCDEHVVDFYPEMGV